MSKSFIKICPKCGGTNIGSDIGFGTLMHIPHDFCKSCGHGSYRSTTKFSHFPEVEKSKIKEFRKNIKN